MQLNCMTIKKVILLLISYQKMNRDNVQKRKNVAIKILSMSRGRSDRILLSPLHN